MAWYVAKIKRGTSPKFLEATLKGMTGVNGTYIARGKGEKPLFPGYLFVDIGETDQWNAIQHAKGLKYFLLPGMPPISIDHSIVERVRKQAKELSDVVCPLTPGDFLMWLQKSVA